MNTNRLITEKILYQEGLKDVGFLNLKDREKDLYMTSYMNGVSRALIMAGFEYEKRDVILAA